MSPPPGRARRRRGGAAGPSRAARGDRGSASAWRPRPGRAASTPCAPRARARRRRAHARGRGDRADEEGDDRIGGVLRDHCIDGADPDRSARGPRLSGHADVERRVRRPLDAPHPPPAGVVEHRDVSPGPHRHERGCHHDDGSHQGEDAGGKAATTVRVVAIPPWCPPEERRARAHGASVSCRLPVPAALRCRHVPRRRPRPGRALRPCGCHHRRPARPLPGRQRHRRDGRRDVRCGGGGCSAPRPVVHRQPHVGAGRWSSRWCGCRRSASARGRSRTTWPRPSTLARRTASRGSTASSASISSRSSASPWTQRRRP